MSIDLKMHLCLHNIDFKTILKISEIFFEDANFQIALKVDRS